MAASISSPSANAVEEREKAKASLPVAAGIEEAFVCRLKK
jgi:hypothetical protein